MTCYKTQKAQIILTTLVAILVLTSQAQADSNSRNHVFFEFGLARADVGGEFDDSLMLSTSTHVINVPEVLPGNGLRFAVGTGDDQHAVSLSLLTTGLKTESILTDDDKAHLKIFGLDYSFSPLGKKLEKVAPIFRCNISWAGLEIDNSATMNGYSWVDTKYTGVSYGLGLGAAIRMGDTGHIVVAYDRQWASFHQLEPQGYSKVDFGESMKGTTNVISIGFRRYMR